MTSPTDGSSKADATGSDSHALVAAINDLRNEIASVRRTQLKMYRDVIKLRHELGYRVGGTREEIGALLKAVHADLAERIDTLDALVDEQRRRFEDMEREIDDILNGG